MILIEGYLNINTLAIRDVVNFWENYMKNSRKI